MNEKQAQKLAFQFKSASASNNEANMRPSSILNSLLSRPSAQQSSPSGQQQQHTTLASNTSHNNNQMTDSFNIYNKKGNNGNLNSGRRQKGVKAPSVGLQDSSSKKAPHSSRNESSKSTPSSALLKAAKSGVNSGSASTNHAKNIQSTGSMMTLGQNGSLRGSSDRYLPLS